MLETHVVCPSQRDLPPDTQEKKKQLDVKRDVAFDHIASTMTICLGYSELAASCLPVHCVCLAARSFKFASSAQRGLHLLNSLPSQPPACSPFVTPPSLPQSPACSPFVTPLPPPVSSVLSLCIVTLPLHPSRAKREFA